MNLFLQVCRLRDAPRPTLEAPSYQALYRFRRRAAASEKRNGERTETKAGGEFISWKGIGGTGQTLAGARMLYQMRRCNTANGFPIHQGVFVIIQSSVANSNLLLA